MEGEGWRERGEREREREGNGASLHEQASR